ncbi:MAG: hypothetical protein Unbinned4944contig1000_27 [Prokaryotic dsDNA virus sp.]|nr:MAG: hypothetical protein Unbinned4944contig1000_27 [Prokaryotic dsDNA virus sp.]|tara:strand:+ start:1476 stop:1733 length:258 start_codon:yes stop_codon:yes gene_type:complete
MTEFVSPIIGLIVNAMALFGAISAIALVLHIYRKRREDSSDSFADENLRNHIDDTAKTEQKAIEKAVSGKSPADDLAKLGNDRRE